MWNLALPKRILRFLRHRSSSLIKEVKLCVGEEHQKALDTLYEKLTSHQLPAEQAVKHLMQLVGSTVVQQAKPRPTCNSLSGIYIVQPSRGRRAYL